MRPQEQVMIVVDNGVGFIKDFGMPVLAGITVAGSLLLIKYLFTRKRK
jgi:hypothetical protein